MAVKPRKKRDETRKASEREEQIEESRFAKNTSLHAWWDTVVRDQRFQHIMRAVKRRKRLRGRIQPSPHAQHVADGYRMGFDDALDAFEGLAYTVFNSPPEGGGELTQTTDPDLEDGTRDEASRRFIG